MKLIIILAIIWNKVVFSSGEVEIADCSCSKQYFLPTYTTWTRQYKGILYSAKYCNTTGLAWNVYIDTNINIPTTCAVHGRLNTGAWMTTQQFDLNQFYSSVDPVESCVVTTFEITVPLNQSFHGIKVELIPSCSGVRSLTLNTCSGPSSGACIITATIDIQDCTKTLVDDVIVVSSELTYNTPGRFSCPHGGRLFYVNGTETTNNATVCLQSAQWRGQDGLQCWRAPSVALEINSSTVCNVIGDKMSLKCLYNDTIPTSDKTRFCVGTKSFEVGKDDPFLLSLEQKHNGSKVYCQAVTPFTEEFTESGKSDTITINVFSKPENVKTSIDGTNDVIKSGSTVLMNSYQYVPLQCTSAADSVNCVWKFNKTQISNSCDTNQYFNQSGFITCHVTNCAGSKQSEENQIIVVELRTARIQESSPIIEGQALNLICEIDYQDTLNTTFQWTSISGVITSNNPSLMIDNITRFDAGKYTCMTSDLFQNSSIKTDVVVLYKPYDVTLNPQLSKDIVYTGSRVLLNGNQDVTLFCDSDANPQANCTFQFAGNTSEFSGACETTHHINSQQLVACFAANRHGNGSSPTVELVVLSEKNKIPNITYDYNNSEHIKIEDDISLNCSVLYQNELNTSFLWKMPSTDRDPDQRSSVLNLKSLTRFDWGNYTCIIDNIFGTTQSFFFVDVLFEPVSQCAETVNCSNSDVVNGTCIFQFFSNPSPDAWTLTTNGTEVPCASCRFKAQNGSTLQTFYFTLTSQHDAEYELTLRSSLFPDAPLTAYIHVTEIDPTPPGTGDQTIVIAASVVGVLVFVSVVIATLVFFYRRNHTMKQPDASEAAPQLEYATVDLTKKNKKKIEKKERINPIYGGLDNPDEIPDAYSYTQGSSAKTKSDEPLDAYAQVDLKKKNRVKEERTNPLYTSHEFHVQEKAYAEVDKTKKIKTIKEEKTNPLYTSHDFSLQEESYAQVDITKKNQKPGKKAKINPLYAASNPIKGNIEETYAMVVRKQNPVVEITNDKEEGINPLYSVSCPSPSLTGETYATVDKSKPETKALPKKALKPPIKKKPIILPKKYHH